MQPLFRYMHIVYIQAVGLCANFSPTDVARGNTQCWRFLDAIFQNRRRRWCPIVPRYQQQRCVHILHKYYSKPGPDKPFGSSGFGGTSSDYTEGPLAG